jgi:hypothetical protein
VTGGRIITDGRTTMILMIPPGVGALGNIVARDEGARFDRELTSPWRPVGALYRADLGAAAARQACR